MSIIQEISQKIHVKWLDLIFLLFLVVYVLAGIKLVPFHGDESTYIWISTDYDWIVKKREFNRVFLDQKGIAKQYIRLSTGSILAYSIGFARDITNNDDPINKWLWGATWDENVAQDNMPYDRILHLARTCSALMGALGIVLFFFTLRHLFSSRLIAWAGTLAFATQGDILVNIRRAMQEGPKFLFLILTLYIASVLLKDLKNKKVRRFLYAFLGVASGLALAAKQDIIPSLVGIYLALGLIPIWQKETARTIFVNLFYLGTATCLAYPVFILSMPVFWSLWETAFVLIGFAVILFQLPVWKVDLLAKPLAFAGCVLIVIMTFRTPALWKEFSIPITRMAETREGMLGTEIGSLVEKSLLEPETAKQRSTFLAKTMFRSTPMYNEVGSFDVPPFFAQIYAYESSLISGRIGSLWLDVFVAILAFAGGWSLLKPFNEESLLAYCLLITSGVLLFVMIPSPWQRYFLIMQIPYSIFIGMGINQFWIWGENLFKTSKEAQN